MLRNYSKRYCELYNEIEWCSEELVVVSNKLGMIPGEKPWDDLMFNPQTDLRAIMFQVKMYARLDDKVKKTEQAVGTSS